MAETTNSVSIQHGHMKKIFSNPNSAITIKGNGQPHLYTRLDEGTDAPFDGSRGYHRTTIQYSKDPAGQPSKPFRPLQIRERMLEKMSDTSRIVDRLVSKGLVKKVTCKEDRRLVDVMITDKGRKTLEKMDAHQDEMDAILGNLSEKEAATLSDLLDKLRSAE